MGTVKVVERVPHDEPLVFCPGLAVRAAVSERRLRYFQRVLDLLLHGVAPSVLDDAKHGVEGDRGHVASHNHKPFRANDLQ